MTSDKLSQSEKDDIRGITSAFLLTALIVAFISIFIDPMTSLAASLFYYVASE